MSITTWRTVLLGEICTVFDGPHATPKKTKDGPIYLGISNLSNGRLDLSEVEHLSDGDYITWTRRVAPKPGDVVFSYETRIGEAAQIPMGFKCCLGRRMGLLEPNTEKVDSRFLLYAFLGPQFQSTLHSHTIHGSTVDRISISELPGYPIIIPPLPIQQRIAEILGRLDDKIEVNRRINRTLEAMAQALYKHWFVNFGPFQDGEFVESELGLIPQGWRVGEMEDLFLLQRGFDLPAPARTPGKYPVMAASGFNGNHAECKVQGPGVVTGRSGVLGKVFYVPNDFWPLNTTLWIREFRVSRPLHAYHFLQNFDLLSFNSGSAVPTLNRNDIHHIPVIVPTPEVVALFEKKVGNWFALIHQNEQEMQKLAEIRDYLLPKLLSGGIPIEAATEQVDEVTDTQLQQLTLPTID